MLEWILNPLTPYCMLAAGLGLCLYLFYSVKLEIHALRKRGAERQERLEAELRAVGGKVAELRASLREQETAALARLPRAGINVSTRTHALRMYRRGEAVPSIAAAVGAPQPEIELLLKVQQLTG
jgi:hypothetical protein